MPKTRKLHHPPFDIEGWVNRQTLKEMDEAHAKSYGGRPQTGKMITSPEGAAIVERIRRATPAAILGRAVPGDIFIMAAGEPERPYITKAGGVPYFRKQDEWPRAQDGSFMSFICQFCFLDSGDLFKRKLPGDVLQMFVADETEWAHSEDPHMVKMRWVDVSPLDKPIGEAQMPVPPTNLAPCHGHIYRGMDYPDCPDEYFRKQGRWSEFLIPVAQATRIGGIPYFIQSDPREEGEEIIAVLNSVERLLRCDDGKTGPEDGEERLMLGDAGCVYFIMDDRGAVRWVEACY
jgi:uncharacterized protein YwqG